MASSKVKEVIAEVVVEEKKPVLRKRTASRRRPVIVPVEAVSVEPALLAELDVESIAEVEVPRITGKKEKILKTKKPKLVRDSFTIPELEYAQLAELKQRCLDAGLAVKKSELLRAGLQALVLMPSDILVKQFDLIEKLKTGRPSGGAE
jgi:hypothetical protein